MYPPPTRIELIVNRGKRPCISGQGSLRQAAVSSATHDRGRVWVSIVLGEVAMDRGLQVTTEWNTPRRRRRRVMAEKKVSTAFSHDPVVGCDVLLECWRRVEIVGLHPTERQCRDHITIWHIFLDEI